MELRAGRPVLGIDVGGTETKVGVVGAGGDVLDVRSEPTALGSEEAILDQLASAVDDARARVPSAPPAAVGVHMPGLIDDTRGTVLLAENLGLRDVAMRDRLQRRTGLPVAFGNDARGAGFAEFRMGAARGFRNAVVITIGTGIGAAVFVDGALHDADGFGCELGHMAMAPPGAAPDVVCACGGLSCLETYASAGGIARAYSRATGRPVDGAKGVFAAARAGDAAAVTARDTGIDMLALALAQLAAVLAPEAIVIAGGLSHARDDLFVPLGRRLEAMLTFHRRPVLLQARFGAQAGVIASALRADELLVGRG